MSKSFRLIIMFVFFVLSFDLFAQNTKDDILEVEKINKNFIEKKISLQIAFDKLDKIQRKYSPTTEFYFKILTSKGVILMSGNKFKEALEVFRQGIELSKKIKNDTLQFKFLIDASTTSNWLFNDEQEFKYLNEANEIYKRNPVIRTKILDYSIALFRNYARYAKEKEDYRMALMYINQDLEIINNSPKAYRNYKLLFMDDYIESLVFTNKYSEAEKILKEEIRAFVNNSSTSTKYNLLLAELYFKQNRISECLQTLRLLKSNLQKEQDYQIYEFRYNLLIAKCLILKNESQEAKKLLNLIVANGGGKGALVAEAYVNLAKIENKHTYFDLALKACQGVKNEYISPRTYVETLIEKAKFEKARGNKQYVATYLTAIRTSADIRKSLNSIDSKQFYAESIDPLFAEALAGVDLGANEVFYEIIEQSKATTLADVQSDQRIKPQQISADLLIEERRLRAEKTKALIDFNETTEPIKRSRLLKTIEATEIKMNQLIEQYRTLSPAYFALKFKKEIAKPTDIQQVIDEETAFVSYLLTPKMLYASVVTKAAVRSFKQPLQPQFHEDLRKFITEIKRRPGLESFQYSGLSQGLYRQLVGFIEGALTDKKRVIFCRDGLLNYLPFEMLEKNAGRYLILDRAVSYAYSATVWHEAIQRNGSPSKQLLSMAPFTHQNALPPLFRDSILVPIEASGQEVEKIGGTILRDGLATKNKFTEIYQKFGLIHFATHAQVDDQNPSKSFLAFSPQKPDYKLFTSELYDLSLQKTQLVVLSACETDHGEFKRGEGLISLTRGFAYSGCPSIVTTLWNANDASTAFLSAQLYKQLKKGQPIDVALQQAKLAYFNSNIGLELDHPYYWANFVLVGNPQPIEFGLPWTWILVFLLVLGGLWWRFGKKK